MRLPNKDDHGTLESVWLKLSFDKRITVPQNLSLGIEGGNLARFKDPEGAVQIYPIGEGSVKTALYKPGPSNPLPK